MGFFGSKKGVSSREIRDVRGHLRARGFSHADIDNVMKVFSGHAGERGIFRGIDKHEIEQGVRWLKDHSSKHTLSSEQIKKLEVALKEKL